MVSRETTNNGANANSPKLDVESYEVSMYVFPYPWLLASFQLFSDTIWLLGLWGFELDLLTYSEGVCNFLLAFVCGPS
jgi:hypothetical protein